jgi:hypothetical protein
VYVKNSVKTSEGVVTFEGELSPEEFDLVLETGLNCLFEAGALPFQAIDEEGRVNMGKGSEELQ